MISLPIPSMSSVMVKCIEKFPISAGVLVISIGMVSCGGIAIICSLIIYFILVSLANNIFISLLYYYIDILY